MSKGRLESRITIPTGGWTGTIDDSNAAGAVVWTVAAGTYYLSSLLDAFEDALNLAAPTDTITVSASLGESGTGKVSITSTGNGTLVWTSTDLRNLLGYSANLTLVASTANTASSRARSMWLADCPYDAPNEIVPWTGWIETDRRTVESPGGTLYSIGGRSKRATWIRWHAVARSRASQANESTTNESFERFVIDGVWGDAAWGTPGGPVKFYPDADASDWVEYAVNLSEFNSFRPEHWADGWAGGPWKCRLERLVMQDSSDSNRLSPTAALLTSGASTTAGTSQATASVTPGSSRAVYAAILAAGTTDAVPTCSGNGITWVQEETVYVAASNNRRLTVFRAMGAAPSSGAITFDFGGTNMGSFAWAVVECPNVNQDGTSASGATLQSVTTAPGSAATSITSTLAALEHSNNLHICFVAASANATITHDADFAELADTGTTTPDIQIEVQWAAGEVECISTFASTTPGTISLEVRAG